MTSREQLLAFLKPHQPATLKEIQAALRLSENAIRHHLAALESLGLVQSGGTRPGRGRPALQYRLTAQAEGRFPKRYRELLSLVLSAAEKQGLLSPLLEGAAREMAEQLDIDPRANARDRVMSLLEQLDYGGMLPELEPAGERLELRAYNCLYLEAGRRFEPVCDLLPKVIKHATGCPAERITCQRDGGQACRFRVDLSFS